MTNQHSRRFGPTSLALSLSLLAAPLVAQEVTVRVETTDDGVRTLVHETVIPASRSDVWKAFTTAEGYMGWAAPFAKVELAVGGSIESSYDPAARPGDPGNIINRILAFVPEQMLAIQATAAPPGFSHAELLPDLHTVVELRLAEDGSTRVVMYGVGYRDTPGHTELLEFFRDGNRWTLGQLHTLFASGPVDWERVLGGGG